MIAHFYSNIVDGYMGPGNIKMLDIALQQFPAGGTWVELGSWTGKSTAYCVVELIHRKKIGRFCCVDTWAGSPPQKNNKLVVEGTLKQTFENNLDPVASYIEMIQDLSWSAARHFEDNSVDFCYVDAGHEYQDVWQDLEHWWPKIKYGALFGGDDYTKGHPGVVQAVHDFFAKKNIKVRRRGRCWLVAK